MENMKSIQEKRNELRSQLEEACKQQNAAKLVDAAKGLSALAGEIIRGGIESDS